MPFVLSAVQLPPVAILGLGIVLVILLITKLGMHPFFSLLVTGMVVGMLSVSQKAVLLTRSSCGLLRCSVRNVLVWRCS